jgi:hypothetical protein
MRWYIERDEIQFQSFWTSAVDGSGEIYVCSILPTGKNPSANSIRGCVGTRGGLDVSEKKINPSTEFRTLGLLARNLSRLSPGDHWECDIKMITKEQNIMFWPGFIWLKIRSSGGMFWTRWWIMGFRDLWFLSGICRESSILKCNTVLLDEYFPDISEGRS